MPSRYLSLVLLASLPTACGPAPRSPRPTARVAAPAKPKISTAVVAELVEKGLAAGSAGDRRAAAEWFEKALAADPVNRTALGQLARLDQFRGIENSRPESSPYFLRSARRMRALLATHAELTDEEKGTLPSIIYNEACTLTLDGEFSRAVASLGEAIDFGFTNLEHIDGDSELDPLRKDPDFQALIHSLEIHRAQAMLASAHPYSLDLTLNDPDNASVSLASHKGKILVVEVWGTWCPPCRRETPHLIELHDRYHSRGLDIVGLNFENVEGDAANKIVRAFVKEHSIPYPCLIGDRDALAKIHGFVGFPTTLFLDRTGNVRLTLFGYQPVSALETAALALLKESPPSSTWIKTH